MQAANATHLKFNKGLRLDFLLSHGVSWHHIAYNPINRAPFAMTGDITIRKAVEADKPKIFELLRQANMHHVPSPEMPALTFENYYVAEAGGVIAGFCGYKVLSPTTAKTELMVVDRTFRSRGVGNLLQEFRMQKMADAGIETLTTNTDLPPTIAWYKKHFGYKEVGTLKKIHEFGDPGIGFWTTLQVDLKAWAAARKK
ncbi:MAG: GNAT family N-acetyltransferase [Thermodesulfobacteriota bacterium]